MYRKGSLSQGILKKNPLRNYLFLVLLVPIFVISIRLFIQPGVIINGDFPSFDVSGFSFERLWLWVDKGSYSGFENLARFPMIGIWALLSLFSVGFDASTKLMIILGFSLCSFSFYFSFYYLLKNRIRLTTPLKLNVALIIGSIFFTYNIWSFNRIDHYYLWIGYSILPIFFVSLVFSFQRFKLKYIVIASLTSIIASSTPHMVIFYGIILIITFLSFVAYYIVKKRFRPVVYSTTTLVALLSLFVIFNLYWIFPYFLSSSSSELIGPTYILNLEITDVLSRDNDLLNTFRLTADWMNFGFYYEPSPPNSILHSMWLFSSYLFPVLALASFVLWVKKIRYSLILFVFFVIGFVLAMGTNIPFDYFNILFTTPILGQIAWVFRDPDKWSFLIAFSYSFFLTMFSVFIFNLFSNRRLKNILVSSVFIVLIISNIAIFAYPIYNYTMEQRYNPIKLPQDFDDLNQYLSSSSSVDANKVFFMPYSDTTPYWSLNHSVTGVYQPGIYQLESALPSNQIFYPTQKNYYNYFTQLIQNNQTKDIGNFIYPLGTSYLIYHNDTVSEDDLSFLNKVYNLSDLQHDKKVGFFDVFRLPKNQSSVDMMSDNNNIAIVQGLDKLSLLDKIQSYSAANSSVLFLDQSPSQRVDLLDYFNNVIAEPSFLNLIFPFIPDEYFISPFDYTFQKNPTFFWSRVNAIDSLHGEFHPYLQPVGIDNWDLDYGKGIVITQASGAVLDIPIEIGDNNTAATATDPYNLFIRYLENFRGGNVKIYIDDQLIDEINTQGTTDNFVWKKIWLNPNHLTKGTHKLTIENANGFNSINAFALVPDNQLKHVVNSVMEKIKSMNLIYLLDQTEFDYSLNNKTVAVPLLFTSSNITIARDQNKDDHLSSDRVVFNGTLNVPDANAINNTDGVIAAANYNKIDSLVLNFETTLKSSVSANQTNTYNPINSIDLIPAANKTIYSEDYENTSNPFDLFGDELSFALANKDNPISNITIDSGALISGNNSLKVDLKIFDPDVLGDWSYIITEFIQVDENVNLKFESKVKTFDINDFHPIVYYYDSNFEIVGENVLDNNMDGSFEKDYNADIIPPRNTAFIQIAFLFLPNANVKSSFLLDDTRLVEIIPRIHLDTVETIHQGDYDEGNAYFTDISTVQYASSDDAPQGDTSTFLSQTKPIPIVNNASYHYQIVLDNELSKNIESIESSALFGESNRLDAIPLDLITTTLTGLNTDSMNQAINAIDNDTDTGYTMQKSIDIINSGNYVFDFRFINSSSVKNLLENKQLDVSVDGKQIDYVTASLPFDINNMSLESNSSPSDNGLSVVANTNLTTGTHKIELTIPDLNTELDFAVVYPLKNSDLLFNETLEPARSLNDYIKINPTKHIVKIENATSPFVLFFSETYDPLWTARIVENTGDVEQTIDNVPLFSIVNGFLINKTGSYDIIIEYKPQTWFYTGLYAGVLFVTIFTLVALVIYYKRKRI